MLRYILSGLLSALLALPAAAQDGERTITGALTYLQKIALPETAEVIVQVEGAFGAILGEVRFDTGGVQVPLPFEVSVPAGLSGRLSALVRGPDRPWWIVEDVAIAAGRGDVELGELRLTRHVPLAFASRFDCGGREVVFGMVDDTPTLRIDGRDQPLRPVPAASGARYVGVRDETLEFWSKGDEAMLTLGGEGEAACQTVAANPQPYTAGGTEPGWHVTLGEDEMELVAEYGALTRTAPRPEATVEPGAYVFDLPGIGARLRLEERICRDAATGMPHPHRATLRLDGQELRGCGGDPQRLLTGGEWRIEDVAGRGIVDASNIAIAFDGAGRVHGSTGCNRFMGGYDLTGEGLSFGRMGATLMACPEALMRQENRVLEALEAVMRFDIDETGALRLIGPDGTALLTARRP